MAVVRSEHGNYTTSDTNLTSEGTTSSSARAQEERLLFVALSRRVIWLFLSLVAFPAIGAPGQQCPGRGNCLTIWVSELGYHHRVDAASIGQHRFTWEMGPQFSYPERGLGVGGNMIAAFDEHGESQLGIKTSAFRRVGTFRFNMGLGVFFLDTRSVGDFTFTAHAAIGIHDFVEATASIDAFENTPTDSESRLYLGARVRRLDPTLRLPSLLLTVVAFVTAIILDARD